MNIKAAIVNFTASVFIFLLCYTAISNLSSLTSFRYNISQSPFIGSYSAWIVVLLPALELMIVVLLFFPKTRLAGLFASLVLMSLFSVSIGYALFSELKLPCSCGGILQSLNWKQHFWVNVILTMLAGLAIFLQTKTSQQKMKFLLQ